MTNLESWSRDRDRGGENAFLQVRAGLGRGTGREIALTFGGLRRRRVGRALGRGLFPGRIHLSLRRRFRWLLVRLIADPHHLPVDELVAVGMSPDPVHERPASR